MTNTTSITVGCAVGIPVFISVLMTLVFYFKLRKRLQNEDIEFQKDEAFKDDTHEISYSNIEGLRLQPPIEKDIELQTSSPSEGSDDGQATVEKSTDTKSKNQKRYVPAYRKKFKSSVSNLNNSRNSSFSNLNQQACSNSSINSSSTNNNNNATNSFYDNVPVMSSSQNVTDLDSCRASQDLAKSLQQPNPLYQRKPSVQISSLSASTAVNTDDVDLKNEFELKNDYDLKNNYDVTNEHEIQEEDQYENEFTNYTESKRAFIESLRPKQN